MKKYSYLVGVSGLLASVAFAQTEEPKINDLFARPTPAPQVQVKENKVDDNFKADFDGIRSNVYSTSIMTNPAGAFTVDDYLAIPHMLNQKKFVYLEPTNSKGAASFSISGATVFLGLENVSDSTGLTTFGYASQGLGVYLKMGLNTTIVTNKPTDAAANSTTTTTTEMGEQFSLGLSKDLGDLVLYGDLYYKKDSTEIDTDNDAAGYTEESKWSSGLNLHIANFPSATDLTYDIALNINRKEFGTELKSGTNPVVTTVEPESNTAVTITANLGGVLASNSYSRALVGMKTILAGAFYDDIDNERKATSQYGLAFEPNFSVEYAVNQELSFTGGVSHMIEFGYYSREDLFGTTKFSDYSITNLKTNPTTVATSARYVYKSIAVEAGLSTALYTDGVSVVFSGNNVLAKLGAIVNF